MKLQRQPDKPTVQQIEFDLLYPLPLGADREQDLDEAGAQQPLRRNRLPAGPSIEGIQFRVQRGQQKVDHGSELAKG